MKKASVKTGKNEKGKCKDKGKNDKGKCKDKGNNEKGKCKDKGKNEKGKMKKNKELTKKEKIQVGKLPSAPKAQSDNTLCLYCEIMYSESHAAWVMYKACRKWACQQCAHVGKEKVFICDVCKAQSNAADDEC